MQKKNKCNDGLEILSKNVKNSPEFLLNGFHPLYLTIDESRKTYLLP